jgi:hypothetical protein
VAFNQFDAMAALKNKQELAAWKTVPDKVAELVPLAFSVKVAHARAASKADLLLISAASWRPGSSEVTVHTDTELTAAQRDKYAKEMPADAVVKFSTAAPDISKDVVVNQSKWPSFGQVWDQSNSAIGGPTPLSHAIVSGLMLGGLGYGAGTLAEQIIPERFMAPGSLRNSFGIMGLLGGAGIGAMNAGETARQLNINYLPAWVTSNNTPIPPKFGKKYEEKTGSFWNTFNQGGNTNIGKPYIPVDAFNRATWADASKNYDQSSFINHTSPEIAAATTGIMSGIKAQTGSGIVSPSTVIRGLASAGVGLGVATLAGKTIGALAGLTPVAQEKIQDIGLWGGMLHSVIPPVLGWR